MPKRNIRSDEDNMFQIHKKQREESLEADLSPREEPDLSDNPAADSQWSTGRQCPRCARRLTIKEFHPETGVLWVECGHCGMEVGHPDIEGPETDSVFRLIPEDMKMRWAKDRERRLNEKK